MTDKLTDEQLRGYAENFSSLNVRAMATELLALRAERAKPAQSDVGRAARVHEAWIKDDRAWSNESLYRYYDAEFASIRAEGSAERAKLEAALREARPCVYSNRKAIDEAKFAPIRKRIDEALAKPAESGATK